MKADCDARIVIIIDAHQGKVAAIAQDLEAAQVI